VRRFLAEDTPWRYAFFHDFNLAAANPDTARSPNYSWRHLYLAAPILCSHGPTGY
jgi:hypothetical protein